MAKKKKDEQADEKELEGADAVSAPADAVEPESDHHEKMKQHPKFSKFKGEK